MKVALITNGAFSVANFRGTLIAELRRRGAVVAALAPDWDDATRSAAVRAGAEPVDISLSRAGTNPLRDAGDVVRLAGLLRRIAPDAVLTYFVKPNVYGTLAAAMAGAPRRIAMVEGLGSAFEEGGGAKRRLLAGVSKLLYRAAFRRADRVVFLNAEDAAFFEKGRLLAPGKAVLLGGIGVDLQRFAPACPVTEPVTFLLAARLLRAKGIVQYLEAASLVKRDHPGARFVLLGAVDANPESLRDADIVPWVERGVVEWPGHQPDVRRWLDRTSVFVLPSYYREGVPRSIQEAMACARPVITTDNVGCRDTVEEGVNGFLVPPRAVAPLAAAMRRFCEEPELVGRMGRESRRLAEERFDARRADRIVADLLLAPLSPPA